MFESSCVSKFMLEFFFIIIWILSPFLQCALVVLIIQDNLRPKELNEKKINRIDYQK